jgi:ABC-type sugar transport system substrate-binding protein
MSHRRLFIKKLTAAAAAVTAALSLGIIAPDALAQAKTVKIGVLHSLPERWRSAKPC